MAPATSLARLRKQVLDLAMNGRMKATEACRSLGISRSRFYELRARYLTYGEAGLLPKPRPTERLDRRLALPLVDQIIAYAIHHPTEGPRTVAAALALPRFGAWRVSHGGVSNVLSRAGLHRVPARLAAAEALSAAEGGPITERALRDRRAQEVTHRHIGSDTPGEQVFVDTMFVGRLKDVGKIWQYSAVDGPARSALRPSAAARRAPGRPRSSWSITCSPSTKRPGSRFGRWWWTAGRSSKASSAGAAQSSGSLATSSRPDRPQRVRRAVPGLGAAPALPDSLPLPLLHLGHRHRRRPSGLAPLLQLRTTPPWLPHEGAPPRRDLLHGLPRAPRRERMGCR